MEQTTNHTATEPAGHDDGASRRSIDLLALFAGLVFVIVAVIGLTDRIVLTFGDLRWIGPILLVAFGIVLVASAAGGRSGNGQPDAREEGAQAPDTPDEER